MKFDAIDRRILAALWLVHQTTPRAVAIELSAFVEVDVDEVERRLAALRRAGAVRTIRDSGATFYFLADAAPRALREGTSRLIDRMAEAA